MVFFETLDMLHDVYLFFGFFDNVNHHHSHSDRSSSNNNQSTGHNKKDYLRVFAMKIRLMG